MFARCISAFKEVRGEPAKVLNGPATAPARDPQEDEREALLEAIHDALWSPGRHLDSLDSQMAHWVAPQSLRRLLTGIEGLNGAVPSLSHSLIGL